MLTPQQILEIVETLYPSIDELNAWITADLIKRLMARIGRGEGAFLTATDDWQLQVYQAAGGHFDAVQSEIARWTRKSDAEIKRIFEDAGIKALAYDSNFYAEHGLESLNLMQSEGMLRILEDTYRRTAATVHNFTRTTAHASQKRLISALDTAHFKVMSGAESYTQAVQEAVADIINEQTKVQYPTGHVDTIETAVLRAVRTGVAQASGNMAIQGMMEYDWDVVLVSAHLGARYGDGGENPGNHFWWQGKFYSRTGRTPDLPLFEESTGYGSGEGLCGWNCRHSFGPGDLRVNPYANFDSDENKRAYDLSQKQRTQEARIRRTKSKLLGLREAINACEYPSVKASLEDSYVKTSRLLAQQNAAYTAFCKGNGIKPLSDRLQIAKWNREEAKKAIEASPQDLTRSADNDTVNFAKASDLFAFDNNVNHAITPDAIFADLQTSQIGREILDYIEKTGIRPQLVYGIQPFDYRGEQIGDKIRIFVDNNKNTRSAAAALIHEITHYRYGIGYCQWAETVCYLKEKMHYVNRKNLTVDEVRSVIQLVKDNYPEYNWREGGYGFGRRF